MTSIKKLLLSFSALAIFLLQSEISSAQGISFSYLVPKNGYISAPISPFSIRGVGIGGLVGLETGFTLYSIPGLSMSGLPFESDKPLTGPNWSVLIPGQATLSVGGGPITVKLLAGGFFIWHANSRINKGNLDRAISEYENWDVATSNMKMNSKPGFGWMAGTEIEYQINNKFAIAAEIQYLKGESDSALAGSYSGGTVGSEITTKQATFDTATTQLEGVEISLGVKLRGK
ncbi:MAG: hypothetical protein ABJG41_07210 [Cyclobacteriaceae bacterium]